ncbi:hypothetical protein [Bacillus piscicola]|uniref:hypothetical protein n=1 Tax=Bacillus piscicola TaxID=1632684 RepID=UPI001F08A970|nr:hypothetical protein [Bacillus piscicola]
MRAGILGPSDMVLSIRTLIDREFEQKITAVPFPYHQPSEATSLINENMDRVDVWVLSGPGLYPFVEKSDSKQPFYYLTADNFSLLQTLMNISYNDGKSIERVSIDFLNPLTVAETYDNLGLPVSDVMVKEYSGEIPLKDYLIFHKKLYEEDQVDICITALRFVYDELIKQDIPAYRILPTRTNIRDRLQDALQDWNLAHSIDSQIAVVLIKVKKHLEHLHYQENNYATERLNIKLEELIIEFSEKISGSFIPVGTDTFLIFSTRGPINEETKAIQELLTKCAFLIDLPANIGIGYGKSAHQAETSARLALTRSQNNGFFSAHSFDASNNSEELLQDPEYLNFENIKVPDHILNKLKHLGVPLLTFRKMIYLQRYINVYESGITALTVSKWLQMTERNARRILSELTDSGVASIAGTIPAETKGRPRNVYLINIDEERSESR